MGASQYISNVNSHNSLGVVDSIPPPIDPTSITRPEGRSVIRCMDELHLHPALNEFGWIGLIDELNDAVRLKEQSMLEPILVTVNGTILAGFGPWRLAAIERRREIHCIEYRLCDEDCLQVILAHHQNCRGWNAFVRISLALTREPYLQQQALENMRTGGKYKGSAALPDVQHIDVRQEIASIAAVGARNVSKVKTILAVAHPRLIKALRDGELTINRAIQFCEFSRAEQLKQFMLQTMGCAINKVIRRSVARPKEERTSPSTLVTLLGALQQQEALKPGSVLMRPGRRPHTVILVGQDLLPDRLLGGIEPA